MNGLSLFTGSGIGELAFKEIIPNYRTVGYVEIDHYCRSIIRARIRDGILDDAPIFDDIRTFNSRYSRLYSGKVDFVSGGFPCQPFSIAGSRKAENDERNMWPATKECIGILRPRFVFLENVTGLLSHSYIWRILSDLTEIGYDCEWDVVGANAIGAVTKRERLWILGVNNKHNVERLQVHERTGTKIKFLRSEPSGDLSNVETSWLVANNYGDREIDEVPYFVDRLKAIGNGWVPQVVRAILSIKA